MKTSDFDFNLPHELIAQTPIEPRDHSRLMVVDKTKQTIEHRQFFNIIDCLKKGDLLVWNNSKVFKARLRGYILLDEVSDGIAKTVSDTTFSTDVILNAPTIEIFLVRPMENRGVWKVLAKPGKKLRLGTKVWFAEDFFAEVMVKEKDGTILVQFEDDEVQVREKANKYGEIPLPPYIENNTTEGNRYQTVYAKQEGSVAAPTAGFHFTQELIEQLKQNRIEFAEITLHVGLGTFLPVKTDVVEEHKMHNELVELTQETADKINQAKKEGRRIIAVGTTTVRTLEGIAAYQNSTELKQFSGDINIFITPGFTFKIIDALVTNFHLPKSTLLMLVSAFMGDREFTLRCYETAVQEQYRFYSFGDAMFIF